MVLLDCPKCNSEKLKFIKEQEASALLSNFGLKTLFSKPPLLGDVLY